MQLILLAAGKGSRLPKKFRMSPKCMVKVNNKTIFERNSKFCSLFKKKIIVTGYKSKLLKKYIKKYNFQEIKNYRYRSTNMVHSAFLCIRHIKTDVLICYSDIIFDFKIFYKLRRIKNNVIPLKKNWIDVWKGRMKNRLISDAEDVVVKKGYISSIGQKIKKKLPKYQYMGILKFKRKDFKNLYKFYLKLKKPKIDFTRFINLAIKKEVIKIKPMLTKKYWFEIDTLEDIKFTEKKI